MEHAELVNASRRLAGCPSPVVRRSRREAGVDDGQPGVQ
jgi:hypothetical protein